MDAIEVRMRCIEAAVKSTQKPHVVETAEEWAAWILAGRPAAEEPPRGLAAKVKDLF